MTKEEIPSASTNPTEGTCGEGENPTSRIGMTEKGKKGKEDTRRKGSRGKDPKARHGKV